MIRKAAIKDAKRIQGLINIFAAHDLMLPRSLNAVYENLRDFFVYAEKGRVLGCCALHIVGWEGLAEIKSLAVDSSRQGKGIGSELVSACLVEAGSFGLKKVFVLTYRPKLFERLKFKIIDKSKLPHKIWAECCDCPKFPRCKEIALLLSL